MKVQNIIKNVITERTIQGNPQDASFVASLMALAKSGGKFKSPAEKQAIMAKLDGKDEYVHSIWYNLGTNGQDEDRSDMVFHFDDQGITKVEKNRGGQTVLVFRRQ